MVAAGSAAADPAGDTGALRQAAVTTVGVHNTYVKTAYPHLADALDAGASMIELDVWDDVVTLEWKVSHDNPLGNDNNCVDASTPADLYGSSNNKDLESCLDDVRVWLDAHPGHPPLTVKLELKAGFDGRDGLGPDVLDSAIRDHLGDHVFRPADLLAKPDGSSYPTLEAAAVAGNWPTRSALAGKVMLEVIPGTFEQSNPFDNLPTDVEYGRYLRDLAAAGNAGRAQVFPSVLGAASGDPRTRFAEADIRPWFVVFDGDASAYVSGIDTTWYRTNNYYLIMTDAQNVAPSISDTTPTEQEARDRVALLAADHASVVSSDWTTLTTVLPEALPRG
jgi:hypothetical protein